MKKCDARKVALELVHEQIRNTGYSLERKEYDELSSDDLDVISNEICKLQIQFEKRYKL